MYQEERIQELLKLIESEGYITVKYLAQKLHISTSSVRRDLQKLEESGLVYRSYGGVQSLNDTNNVPNFTVRIKENKIQKQQIARKGIELIRENDVIFIDSSSTCFYLTEYVKYFKHLTIFSNNLEVLTFASQNHLSAYSTGGLLSPENPSALIGSYVEHLLNNIHVDLFFFSSQALSNDGIISDCHAEENHVRSIMLKHSSRSVFLCDSSKINRTSAFQLCYLDEIEYIICDKDPSNSLNLTLNHTKILLC
ncbi:DeoR/GlpR family DNA-binding transcription regulator [Robinsoniella sp. KNHs210]|uniref:DeoR/GlpR family DNA-binding transcription regulator n=1 Tax=Robinsoniella sp. KNHs210 TaxID=1469950 RepID=UPI0018CC0361|nr:DeoR/GlpR family DNA-binding transcription regulator [Robinsoniella sp. KNHs210]